MASGTTTRPQNMQPDEGLGFYCRIAKLLLSVGTNTLRELFVHIVGDVGVFLRDQRNIRKLRSAKCICKYQWETLTPPSGAAVDVDEFDITLLSALLLNVCNLSNDDQKNIKAIRKQRNNLCHSHDASITEEGFQATWEQISKTLCRIASICGPAFEHKIQREIVDLQKAPIDVKREQQYFTVLLEHCLSDRDFQRDIKALQFEANVALQQLIKRLCLFEQHPQLCQIIQNLNELNDVMKDRVLTKDEMSSKCSSLIDDVNEIVNYHLLSLQKEIKKDLQFMSQSIDEATDLIRTDVQERREYQQHMEHRIDAINDKLAQKERPVVNLIDDALLDKFTDGIKKFPNIIKRKFTSNQKMKSELERQNSKQHDQDQQIKLDHEIAVEFQNQFISELSRKPDHESRDPNLLNEDNTKRQDLDMAAEYREEIEKGVELDFPRGIGPDTVFLLDTSSSMERNGNFLKMIEITGNILQGIANESVSGVLDENVAFVTFGNSTSITQHLTNDQSCWIDVLDYIKNNGPGGPSDLCKGLEMSRAAIQVNKTPLEAYRLCISARIVLITDGNVSELSEQSESFQNREKARHQAYSLVEESVHNSHRVFCVPLCSHDSPRYRFLEKLAHRGSGCVVRPDEIQYITRYHRKILWALRVESCHPGIYISEGTFIPEILKGAKLPFTDDEVEDMMEIVANSDRLGYQRAAAKTGRFEDPYDNLPPLGTRVKQGEHWREDVFEEHHCGPGTGTVIGQEADSVWVEWDGCEDGMHYKYKYGLNSYYEVRVHDRPRAPEEGKTFLVGCCITRIEWEGDEPEDPLGYGLVFITNPTFETFGVRWKNGDANYYKYDFVCCAQEELPSPWCFGPE